MTDGHTRSWMSDHCDYCDRLLPKCYIGNQRYNVPCTHSDDGNDEAEKEFYRNVRLR
jgi:hypothetical protein